MASFDVYRLDRLVGRQIIYQGVPCHVIEVLEDGPQLVLEDSRADKVIQANQHNEASRRVPRTYTVKLLNARRDALNPRLMGSGLETMLE